ncbi:HMCN [Mytilus edulis]|uniref:HMCN n=1 Tax=Mytilus edulis TaxID=6550 RepID=A0A8S3TJ02_MYTED|nr:HMCN [Mytilus edulis]
MAKTIVTNYKKACILYYEGDCSSNCGNGDQRLKLICPSHEQYFTSQCTRYTGCSDGWSTWEHFGTCSKTCNEGQQVFRRRCVTTIPGLVSTNCVSDNVKYQLCNIGECPGSWTCWKDDGQCSTSCGNGRQIRRRRCDNPNDGDECSGENITSVHCNIKKCPVYKWGHLKELNLTKDDLKEVMKDELDEMKSNLTIDSKNMSATIRKRISARDARPSAASVGYVGVALLLIPLLMIISFDVPRFWAMVTNVFKRQSVEKNKC